MNKLLLILLFLLPFFLGCEDDGGFPEDSVIQVAWDSLSEQEKSSVVLDWRKAPVEVTKYEGRKAYSVRFNTVDDALLGPIFVYVDYKTNKVIGYGTRL